MIYTYKDNPEIIIGPMSKLVVSCSHNYFKCIGQYAPDDTKLNRHTILCGKVDVDKLHSTQG